MTNVIIYYTAKLCLRIHSPKMGRQFPNLKSQNTIPLNRTCCITLNPSLLAVSFGCLTPRGGFVGGTTAAMSSTCLTFAGYDNITNR